MSANVIFIDDEEHLRTACSQALELAGFAVESHATADGALDRIDSTWPGVIVTDVKMAGMTGLELMAHALERDPELPVILVTGHGDVPMAVAAMREGAYDFIEKPFGSDMLVDAVRRAADRRRLVLENRALKQTLSGDTHLDRVIVGTSAQAARLRDDIAGFAPTDADVLIRGETGTGKELAARALHEMGPRAGAAFVPVNCAALPATLIESELFGHERGAFTGAATTRIGKFEHADGGTLFLDEVESMPVDMQGRLLRVLEDRTVVRLGSNDERPVDVRVIAATKHDLRDSAAQHEFRDDLFYRLNVLTIDIPPLRNRREDIAPLMAHFLDQAAARFRRPVPEVASADMARLSGYDWPGNIRELKNAAMRYALGQGLGLDATPADTASNGDLPEVPALLPDRVAAFEKETIRACLERHGRRLKPTYEELGISRKTLYDKIRKYALDDRALADE